MTGGGVVIFATRSFIAADAGPFRAASMLSAAVGVWAQKAIALTRKAIRVFIVGQYTGGARRYESSGATSRRVPPSEAAAGSSAAASQLSQRPQGPSKS